MGTAASSDVHKNSHTSTSRSSAITESEDEEPGGTCGPTSFHCFSPDRDVTFRADGFASPEFASSPQTLKGRLSSEDAGLHGLCAPDDGPPGIGDDEQQLASSLDSLAITSGTSDDVARTLDLYFGKHAPSSSYTSTDNRRVLGSLSRAPRAFPSLQQVCKSPQLHARPQKIPNALELSPPRACSVESASSLTSGSVSSSDSSVCTPPFSDIRDGISISNGLQNSQDVPNGYNAAGLTDSAGSFGTLVGQSFGKHVKRPPSKPNISLNSLIKRICVAGLKNERKFCMSEGEIKTMCRLARELFLSQPVLLELGTPVKIVGDLHGQFRDLMRIFRMSGMPPRTSYLFLGDYVDRGKQSLETIMLLFCLKLKFPQNFFLLRGNHECANVTKVYGFYDECKRRSSIKVWKAIVDVFNVLPIAATVGGRIFCVHGGLSPYLSSLNQIYSVSRPTDVPESGVVSDLLWSDPDPQVKEWSDNDRGVSFCFGKRVLDKFCRDFKFDLVARGHMVVEDGYEFFGNRKLITIFSAPNYCGDFDNWGAVMAVDRDLLCSFELLEPSRSVKSKVRANR